MIVAPDVAEHPADLVSPRGDAPLREVDLGVVGEQLEDAAARVGHAGVVEGLQVLERDRFRSSSVVPFAMAISLLLVSRSGSLVERWDRRVDIDPDGLRLGVLTDRLEAHLAPVAGQARRRRTASQG